MEFSDGSCYELTFNQIAGAMFSQIYDKGHHFQLLRKIIDHKSNDNTILISDGFIKSINGNNVPNNTIYGWNRIELSEYAINNKIEYKPVFHRWVSNAEKKIDRVIAEVAKKYWKTYHKSKSAFQR